MSVYGAAVQSLRSAEKLDDASLSEARFGCGVDTGVDPARCPRTKCAGSEKEEKKALHRTVEVNCNVPLQIGFTFGTIESFQIDHFSVILVRFGD